MNSLRMAFFRTLFFVTLCFIHILCEEVEYYPSQSQFNKIVQNQEVILKSKNFMINKVGFENNKISKLRHFNYEFSITNKKIKRAADPVFHGHPKTREEVWNERFLNRSTAFDQTSSLIKLIYNITLTYLNECIPVMLYDSQAKQKESYLFQNLLKDFPVSYIHGYINDSDKMDEPKLLNPVNNCQNYIVFVSDVGMTSKVLGKQAQSKVVVVARSSQWAVQEFLASPLSRMFVNLLVIGQSFRNNEDESLEAPYILYTHELYTDGLGASEPKVLTSWSLGKYTRNVNLFPQKMKKGYAGHRFLVAAANQPPFVIKRIISDADGGNPKVVWDGIEVRILQLLAEKNNFSIETIELREIRLGSGDAVAKEIMSGRADIGIAGMYVTTDRASSLDISFAHSQDCAAFVTLMSTALPRYRAILGPFHWHVWVAMTFTYLIGIFPLAFSDKHSLRHLLHNSGEVENMFWYVFGTFTNCFTFVGKNSWSKTTKITTRLLIGWYWVFTIIITSCYTGSIIAYVTLPIFPESVDSIQQLLSGFYRTGTLDRGGWERWFFNSSDPDANKLLKRIELVPNIQSGIRNTTRAFFWPYAFLGSKAELQYIVQSNYSKAESKRAVLHVSKECFVPFGVAIGFPNNSIYSEKLSEDIRKIVQNGIINKIVSDVKWEIQRSSTGKLLTADSESHRVAALEERGLTLEDTQGMFLLLGAGFLIAAAALISEWMGGISRKCCSLPKKKTISSSNSNATLLTTPKSDVRSEISICDDVDSKLKFSSRSHSAGSRNTLDGQIIDISTENILIHDTFDSSKWASRRSSSADVDQEVKEIFEKDMRRRRILSNDFIVLSENERMDTKSQGTFGDHLPSHSTNNVVM